MVMHADGVRRRARICAALLVIAAVQRARAHRAQALLHERVALALDAHLVGPADVAAAPAVERIALVVDARAAAVPRVTRAHRDAGTPRAPGAGGGDGAAVARIGVQIHAPHALEGQAWTAYADAANAVLGVGARGTRGAAVFGIATQVAAPFPRGDRPRRAPAHAGNAGGATSGAPAPTVFEIRSRIGARHRRRERRSAWTGAAGWTVAGIPRAYDDRRRTRVQEGAISHLSIPVSAPAKQGAVGGRHAAMVLPEADRLAGADAQDGDRSRRVIGRAIPELSVAVSTPTTDSAADEEPTAVLLARRDLRHAGQCEHARG